jgi:hypothetical protein
MIVWHLKQLVVRKERRLAGTEVSEHDARRLVAGVGALPNPFGEMAARRLARLFQTPPLHVVEPTVIDTSKAAIFQASIAEIRSAVGAVETQKAELACVVASR